jgi:acetolactate synthase-1/2/3 large subunit
MKITGSEIIIQSLKKNGIDTLSGIPGGANLPLYDALSRSGIRHILARHEQGAGFIAQGMARATGRTAVCLATSGPGATNLVTAIADAKCDSVPMVAITGQVSLPLLGTDAFQEVDTHGITTPVAKHTFLVRTIDELPRVMDEAFRLAGGGRPGPVVVDVPKDIQMQSVSQAKGLTAGGQAKIGPVDEKKIIEIARMINSARRPILYLGGGVISSDSSEPARELSRRASIPVTSSLMGLGSARHDDPLYLGMLGMHAERSTNFIVHEADLIMVLGARFDDRATGRISEFCNGTTVIHIDIDGSEIDKIKKSSVSLNADLRSSLEALLPHIEDNPRMDWRRRMNEIRLKNPSFTAMCRDMIHPVGLIRAVGEMMPEDTIITTDVGQHQMWVAQSYPFTRPRTFLTSGGLGTMGFGLPAAIGAALACPGRNVVCFSGDGSIMMNIQELATLADLDLNIKILVMNNSQLGLVRQQQQLFYDKNYFACRFSRSMDFAALARQFGIGGRTINPEFLSAAALGDMLHTPGPALFDVSLKDELNVYPMVPPGASNCTMIGGEIHD